MKKHIIILSLLLLVGRLGYAQEIPVRLSLEQAYQLGLENRFDARANKINIDLAENTIEKNKKAWLPDITASADIRDNTQLQKQPFSDDTGNVTTITMGAKNFTVFALDLTQNIYKPGLNTDIKIARNNALLEQEKNKEKEISIRQRIAEAYLNVLLKELQWKSSRAMVERNRQYYSLARDKHRLNVLLENDLLKSSLDYENAKLNAQQAKHSYDLALTQLKYELNFNNDAILLTDSIETFQQEYHCAQEDTISNARTELRQLELEYESSRLGLKKSRQNLLPTISLLANYSTQYQGENFYYDQHVWSPFNYVELKISMPITGSLKNTSTVREYTLKMTQNQMQLKQKRQEVMNEIYKYKTELTNAGSAVNTSRNNLELSNRVYQNQLNLYKLGTVTYASVLDTESSLNTSEQNYIKAVYNLLMAKVNFEKAIGKL